jgi:ERCC4-type nuclease
MASAKLVSGDFAWLVVPVEASTSECVSRGLMLNTGVERKRVTDLVASIKDQRLKTQMCGHQMQSRRLTISTLFQVRDGARTVGESCGHCRRAD